MRELRIVDAAQLASVYADALYAVVLDGDALQLQVGEQAIDVEAYWPARRYAFITAWNPASIPQPEAANDVADAELVAQLDALGIARQPAHAYDPRGRWREAGWLVVNVESHRLDALAREFGQAGVLDWGYGEPVRLRMLMPRPPHAPPLPYIDWAGPTADRLARSQMA